MLSHTSTPIANLAKDFVGLARSLSLVVAFAQNKRIIILGQNNWNTRMVKYISKFYLLLALLAPSSCNGFAYHDSKRMSGFVNSGTGLQKPLAFARVPSVRNQGRYPLSMALTDDLTFTTMTISSVSDRLGLSLDSPTLQSQFLLGMAHTFLDFSGLTGAPRILVRLCAVVGRGFFILNDFYSDHSINAQEGLIQVFLIYLAVKEVLNLFQQQQQQQIPIQPPVVDSFQPQTVIYLPQNQTA